ncbi:MAG: hypothetical protein CBB97_19790 [Candidatus Endolissoclinum sp. TMED37]|nr:MAG: hypothetical protein CBB97_19790 [Candidatus Endolissoclinum sp. TMED37]|tara:strand:- start:698 stop:1552 length:855 start_codon:yes stop_codon:yes gene_type:complete
MAINSQKLKIGFLIDDERFSHNVYELISMVMREKTKFKPIILVDKTQENKNKLKTKSLLSKEKKSLVKSILYRAISKLETIILNNSDLSRNIKIPNVNSIGLEKYIINCNISNSHLYKDYDQNISQIHNLKLDLIIRCGTGIFKGLILNSTKYGILSSHHGDNRYYRGGPGGFWEVYNNSADSGFVIQRLNEKLDAGDVLARNNFITEKLWFLNKYKLQKECNKAWIKLLNYIYRHNKLPEKEKETNGVVKINKFPENIVLFDYFIKKSLCQFIKFFLSNKKNF